MTDIPIESQRAVVHLVRTWWDDSYAHNMAEAGNDDVVREDFQDTYPRLVEAGFVYGPVAARAALQSLRERVEGPAMRVVKTLFAEVGDGDEEPTTIYAGNLDECIAAIRAAVLAEIDEALG
jgi:hypothetical protein